MTFSQAIKTVFSRYAQFGGLSGRSEFWWWILFTVVGGVVLGFADQMLGNDSGTGFLSTIWTLGTLVPTLAVAVRRLRDASFHWAFLFLMLLPIVGLIVLAVMFSRPGVLAAPPLY